VSLFWGGRLGPHLTQRRLSRGLPPYEVASWSMQPLATIEMFRKLGGSALLCGELVSHLTQSRLSWGLPPSNPSEKGALQPPIFGAFLLWPTAAWIKMPLGTEVGLGPGHIVLDEGPNCPQRAQPPISGPCLLSPNGCMDQDATWYVGKPRSRRRC